MELLLTCIGSRSFNCRLNSLCVYEPLLTLHLWVRHTVSVIPSVSFMNVNTHFIVSTLDTFSLGGLELFFFPLWQISFELPMYPEPSYDCNWRKPATPSLFLSLILARGQHLILTFPEWSIMVCMEQPLKDKSFFLLCLASEMEPGIILRGSHTAFLFGWCWKD